MRLLVLEDIYNLVFSRNRNEMNKTRFNSHNHQMCGTSYAVECVDLLIAVIPSNAS